MSASRVEGGSTNSVSRLRSGFSPSLVRKSVQRDRMLPAMCFTITAMELDSLSKGANSCSSLTCAMAASPIFLYWRKTARESFKYDVVNSSAMVLWWHKDGPAVILAAAIHPTRANAGEGWT